MSAPAILPPALVADAPRLVSELRSGETGYVGYTDLAVNMQMECFLEGDARLRENVGCSIIAVTRRDDGLHVVVPSNIRYEPRNCRRNQLVPVASVTIGPPEK